MFNWQNLLVIWLFDGFCLFDGVEQQIMCNLSRLGGFWVVFNEVCHDSKKSQPIEEQLSSKQATESWKR